MFYGYSFCCCLLFLFLSFCLSSFPSSFSMNDFLCFLLSYFSFFKGICWRMGLLYGINASYIFFVIKVLLKWNCSISHIFLSVFVLIFFSILSNFICSFAKIYWDRLPNLFFYIMWTYLISLLISRVLKDIYFVFIAVPLLYSESIANLFISARVDLFCNFFRILPFTCDVWISNLLLISNIFYFYV